MNLFVLFFLHIALILGDHEKQCIVQRQDKKKKKRMLRLALPLQIE